MTMKLAVLAYLVLLVCNLTNVVSNVFSKLEIRHLNSNNTIKKIKTRYKVNVYSLYRMPNRF